MQKNKALSIGTNHMQEKKNMIFGGNRPEIIEFCKKKYIKHKS
jgi:hypothetical protein